jgi:hypothetical protein
MYDSGGISPTYMSPSPQQQRVNTMNLFFKDKKHGLILVTTCTDAEINTSAVAKLMKLEGKSNLRLANEATLIHVLGCPKGCVGPLSIMNSVIGVSKDESCVVKLVNR